MLADRYPKCFFENPSLRQPLKKNIFADLQKDGVPVASELLSPAIEWYESHFCYQYGIKAGANRIDLNGKQVQVVTEQEQRSAEKYIAECKQRQRLSSAVQTTAALHRAKLVPDDALRKIDAPPKVVTTELAPAMPNAIALVQSRLDAIARTIAETADPALRDAFAVVGLRVVIAEAERLIDSLGGRR